MERAIGRKYEVAILHEDAHFDALKSISRFYKLKNFCVDCEEAISMKGTPQMQSLFYKLSKTLKLNYRPNAFTVDAFRMAMRSRTWLRQQM